MSKLAGKVVCWDCSYRRNIPGDCHIGCARPGNSPKPRMHKPWPKSGFYPLCFDANLVISCAAKEARTEEFNADTL